MRERVKRVRTWRLPEAGGGTGEWSARPRAGGMRETAMEADHESDDALTEGAGEWRWASMAVVGWSEAEAMAADGGRWANAERYWERNGVFRPSYPVCSRLRSFLREQRFLSVKNSVKYTVALFA
jgi:hypothetical protein